MATNANEPSYPDAPHSATFQTGLQFQDFVVMKLAEQHVVLQNLGSKLYQIQVGENLQGFEIKYDGPCLDTQRLSIEIAEKTRNDEHREWTPSGIFRSDNSWLYIQGNYLVLFIFSKNHLVRYFNVKNPAVTEKFGTIRTWYLSFADACVMAAKVIWCGQLRTDIRG